MQTFEANDLGHAVAGRVREVLSVLPQGGASVALVGGRTASLYLDALFALPLDWNRIAITLADDRLVPPEHPDSNFGAIRTALRGTLASAARLIPLAIRYDDAALAAQEAGPRLQREIPWPLDIVILGLGDDGHFASIFPDQPDGLDSNAICFGIAEPPPPHRHPRVSLTIAALVAAKMLLLPLAGDAKRRVLASALETSGSPVAELARRAGDRLHMIAAN